VRLILGVTPPIIVERIDLVADMLAHAVRLVVYLGADALRPMFVDIVAIVEHGIEFGLLRQVAIGGVISALPMLTTGDADAEPIDPRAGRRRRANRSDRALHSGGTEPVPVTPSRL